MKYVVVAEGLSDLIDADIGDIPDEIRRKAVMAINRTVEWARTQASREMRRQVAFRASYLTGAEGRLRIAKKASGNNLEASIVGRQRATSLARFAKNPNPATARRRGGVNVEVKPGSAKFMKGAFLVRLRAGTKLTETQHNLGLAIRLKPGETLRNKKNAIQLDRNVYILYGPSVDQVFRTVSGDMSPDALVYLEREFDRLRALKVL